LARNEMRYINLRFTYLLTYVMRRNMDNVGELGGWIDWLSSDPLYSMDVD